MPAHTQEVRAGSPRPSSDQMWIIPSALDVNTAENDERANARRAPSRIDVALPSTLSWTKMTPNQRSQNRVTPISHNAAILRMRKDARAGIPRGPVWHESWSHATKTDRENLQSKCGWPYRLTASGSASNSEWLLIFLRSYSRAA